VLWELVLGLYGSRRAGQLVPAAEGKKMKEKKSRGRGHGRPLVLGAERRRPWRPVCSGV